MKQEYCCKQLELLLEHPECPISYRAHEREYVMATLKKYLKRNEICKAYTMNYCPCCGTAFPKSLYKEWWDLVVEKFNIEDIFDPKIKKLPKEFRTDQWWKKRGL